MKLGLKRMLMMLSCLLLFTMITSVVSASEYEVVEALGAKFQITENVIDQEIGYGIRHRKDKALSTSTTEIGGTNTMDPQSINVLEVPSSEDVRIINWTYKNSQGWTKQTVKNMAKDFEMHNPGWIVLAAVNGDFFDINGNNKVLPYQTGGVAISNGEVYRTVQNTATIGFKNDGSNDPLVAEETFEVTGHNLNIFDENDQVIASFPVNYFNENPVDDGVAIWFNCRNSDGTLDLITAPGNNNYLVEAPERVLPMGQTEVYAKGIITLTNTEKKLNFGQFAIQTTNEAIQALLSKGVKIRVQRDITGAYANCDDITGGGITLVRDGVANNGDISDGMSDYRHPRTCVGMKEDGTIVFMTVDGRQASSNMYGMTYAELAASFLYYDCVEAYNLDGGGSTTMIIRNAYGEFDVVNSPSDGSERHDANTLLIVVPEISFQIEEVTDTDITFDYILPVGGVEFTDIEITINNETKTDLFFPYTWTNLQPLSNYQIEVKYKTNYKNSVKEKNQTVAYFTTGKNRPLLEKYYYVESGDNINVFFNIVDNDQVISFLSLSSGDYFQIVNKTATQLTLNKSQINVEEIVVSLEYNLMSSSQNHRTDQYKIEKLQEFTITYNLNRGKLNNPINNYYSQLGLDILPVPTRRGYTFIGWQLNNVLVNEIEEGTTGNLTLNALWEKEKGCNKDNSLILIETLSVISLGILFLKKKQ